RDWSSDVCSSDLPAPRSGRPAARLNGPTPEKDSGVTGKLLEPGQIEAAAERPPFIHLPPHNLFALRASQFDALANDHPLGDYLRLLAGVCRAQQQVLDQPPTVPELSERRIRESLAHGLPPLSADTLVRENGWQAFLDAWLDQVRSEE